ncbi:outer membrane beta-barrel protein [Carboxylicivirga taeanensis]|uniref:outer membrane beta-barrel protein n=1 Tax=Carboxylicivirga taeanensis TaxID=1416875 RepID=UPI003F6DB8E4
MKSTMIVFAINVLLSGSLFAQNSGSKQNAHHTAAPNERSIATSSRASIEFTPITGYSLNGSLNLYKAKFKMKNAAHYGGILSLQLRPDFFGEFSYTRSKTFAHYKDFVAGQETDYDMAIDYFQLGGLKELSNGPLVPFGMFALGITWFNMQTHGVSDHVSFSMALGGGVKYFFSDRLGIRLQGRLLLPMYFSGGGLFLGIGSGGTSSGVGISTGVLAVQGDFSSGLIFRF